MKVTRIYNNVDVIGRIWMPSVVCAQTFQLTSYDVENARDEDGDLTRESLTRWLDTHAGDFSEILDFSADIGDNEFVSDWADELSAFTFSDAMFGDFEDA